MYCCGPEFLWFEEGFQIGQMGNSSESCLCHGGWISIGFNPFPEECDQGATICSGNLVAYQAGWFMASVGLVSLFTARTVVIAREGRRAILEWYKFLADCCVLGMVLGNLFSNYEFDIIENKLGYLFLAHWLYLASLYDRLVLMRGMSYLRAKAVFQSTKVTKTSYKRKGLTEFQRAIFDAILLYAILCWSSWAVIIFDSLEIGTIVRYVPIITGLWQLYSFATNALIMRKILTDLQYVAEMSQGKILVKVNRAIRIAEASLKQFKVMAVFFPLIQGTFVVFYQILRESQYVLLFLLIPLGFSQELKVLLERIRTGKRVDMIDGESKTSVHHSQSWVSPLKTKQCQDV